MLYGPVLVSCAQDNEPSGCTEGGEFLDQLSDYQLPNKDSSLWSYINNEVLSLHNTVHISDKK
jgi:hypothetical protein